MKVKLELLDGGSSCAVGRYFMGDLTCAGVGRGVINNRHTQTMRAFN